MQPPRPLAPCLVGSGTLTGFRDMLRALETLEGVEYRYLAHGELVDEGTAALVKLMADSESATLVVNGCLFLNVASFRYLDFSRAENNRWSFSLHGDSSLLELVSIPESGDGVEDVRPHLLSDEIVPGFDALIALDDEDEDD